MPPSPEDLRRRHTADDLGEELVNPNAGWENWTEPFGYELTAEESWESLAGLAPFSWRKIGGIRLDGIADPAVDAGYFTPERTEPWAVGDKIKFNWHYLRGLRVGGYGLYGLWSGPGAQGRWFTRPMDSFDVVSKLHDFAYEANGLRVADKARPEAYWSRKAKADAMFFLLADSLREMPSNMAATHVAVARDIFDHSPLLFRQDDCFINPLRYMPKDWLLVPYSTLPRDKKPSYRVPAPPSAGRNRAHAPSWAPDYNQPVAEFDTADGWMAAFRPLTADPVSFDAVIDEVRALTGAGSDFTQADPWQAPVSRELLAAG
jgi:hypothetical protein